MPQQGTRTRLFGSLYNADVFDGRIERIIEVPLSRGGMEVHIDFSGLRPTHTQALCDRGLPWELVRGERVPLRLRFIRARWEQRSGIYATPDSLPEDHPACRLFAVTHIRLPHRPAFYHLFTDGIFADDVLALRAQACLLEARPGASLSTEEIRRWARRPPLASRIVPMPRALHQRHGGDPIAIHIGQRVYRHRFFIGGLHHQVAARPPSIDHVVNLCGEPNPWQAVTGAHAQDYHLHKGEMSDGMTASEILTEASWIAERLRGGQRVLVHCYAGMNRSSTLACATLMLLEGLSPEDALARVREHHPETAPDPYHWFNLCWLASSGTLAAHPLATASHSERPLTLRRMAQIR